jgi:putative oxidoreductase
MDILVLIARILFVGLFLSSGYGHLTQTAAMTGYAQSRGVPAARIMVLASGILIIVGALMVLLGIWGDLGALFLIAFLLPTAVWMHGFWKETEPMARITEQVQFSKDIALSGGALAFLVLFAYAGDNLGLTITGPLFNLS